MTTSPSAQDADLPSLIEAMADPVRLRLLQLLFRKPSTVKEMAADLDLTANRLYYHLRLLEGARLVEIDGYRPTNRGAERVYRSVSGSSPEVSQEEGLLLALAMLGAAQQDLTRRAVIAATEPGEEDAQEVCRYTRVSVPAAAWSRFLEAVNALVDELEDGQKAQDGQDEAPAHNVLFAAYNATD